jgi:hypothetical protein
MKRSLMAFFLVLTYLQPYLYIYFIWFVDNKAQVIENRIPSWVRMDPSLYASALCSRAARLEIEDLTIFGDSVYVGTDYIGPVDNKWKEWNADLWEATRNRQDFRFVNGSISLLRGHLEISKFDCLFYPDEKISILLSHRDNELRKSSTQQVRIYTSDELRK